MRRRFECLRFATFGVTRLLPATLAAPTVALGFGLIGPEKESVFQVGCTLIPILAAQVAKNSRLYLGSRHGAFSGIWAT